MPLLPKKALRRLHGDADVLEEAESQGRRRVTRGVTLAPAEDLFATPQRVEDKTAGVMRCKSLTPADLFTQGTSRSRPLTPLAASDCGGSRPLTPMACGEGGGARAFLRRPSAPPALTPCCSAGAAVSSPRTSAASLVQRKVWSPAARTKVSFAPSPLNQTADVTPYAQVYGVHPAFFDFDQQGMMQPTAAGHAELQKGSLRALTPSSKGRKALVVQGNASPSSSSSPVSRLLPRSTLGFFPSAAPFAMGEEVLVLTDDGQAWMDGQIIAVFSTDSEAEGYSIPGGTVKVSYEMGIKWVMPQNIHSTVRKKAPLGNYLPMPPRQGHPGMHQQLGPSWQKMPNVQSVCLRARG